MSLNIKNRINILRAKGQRRRKLRKHKHAAVDKNWRDWLVPLKHNVFIQFSIMLALLALSYIGFSDHLTIIEVSTLSLIFAAVVLILGITEFGRGTVKSYRRVRHNLSPKNIDMRLQQQLAKQMYCYRTGARAAAAEKGLSNQLIPKLRNWWCVF